MEKNSWDFWVEEALSKLQSLKLLRSLRPIYLSKEPNFPPKLNSLDINGDAYEVFDEMRQWDRSSVRVSISDSTFRKWLLDIPSSGNETESNGGVNGRDVEQSKMLILFSSNDYLGLSSHPTIGKAAAKAAQEHGMGPRGSALICGYTNYHRLLESSLADLKKKEDCLLCPTGFAANMAVMVAIGNISSLLGSPNKEKVAIFSDELNHASIIDGIRLAERQKNVEVHVYRHCDMFHLRSLLSYCTLKRKVVVTDSLFSMDGDFAPMTELAELRRKHGFLLVIDDAHGTFICGKNGGGVAEQFNCEEDIDVCVGTLSKAAGCHGGFIACSKMWKKLIQSRGRSFIFSTATPVPVAAAAHAAVSVAKKEVWRRRAIWERVQQFQALTGIPISSPIVSLVIGSEEKALDASRHLLKSGFHVTAIRPPTVPPNSCRLRVTLCATHTEDDLKELIAALSSCIDLQEIGRHTLNGSNCTLKRKVVVTDSLFSMDGDFAKLRRKHGFLLVIDDAHGTFICGENGGGVAEQFNCESDVDICVGTLSKAAGCHGGFIACKLRVTLCATHTEDDLKELIAALSSCINLQEIGRHNLTRW